jgi:hypothetical protein
MLDLMYIKGICESTQILDCFPSMGLKLAHGIRVTTSGEVQLAFSFPLLSINLWKEIVLIVRK